MDSRTTVLLHHIEGPVNLGAVCRAMMGTGFTRLRFSGDLTIEDPRARDVAAHAGHLLEQARHVSTFEQLIKDRDVVFGLTPRHPWEDGRSLTIDGFHSAFAKALRDGARIGLLFGNEQRGLENAQLARCHYRVSLPTSSGYASMNLSQAVLVVLWELRRRYDTKAWPIGEPSHNATTAEERQVLLDHLADYLSTIDFLNPQNPEAVWQEVQQLFGCTEWRRQEQQLLVSAFDKAKTLYLQILARSSDLEKDGDGARRRKTTTQ